MKISDEFSSVFKKLRNITFTLAGRAHLSCFTDETLLYADNAVGMRDTLASPYGYFLSICRTYSRENYQEVDSGKANALCQKHNVKFGDECVEAFTPHAEGKKIKKEATPWPNYKRKVTDENKGLIPLKGRQARRQVATIKEGMLKGVCSTEELLLYIQRQRDAFSDETEGLFDLYNEMMQLTPSEAAPISKEVIQKLLPF